MRVIFFFLTWTLSRVLPKVVKSGAYVLNFVKSRENAIGSISQGVIKVQLIPQCK